jgi:serine/threonine protein kinase
MQLLRGSTLEALLNHADYQSSPPSVAWAAAIAVQIAAVFADVHRVDIVHRDIKPGTVMIANGGLVKVLDFGIAILRGAGALPRLTQVDRTVGTPAYMSPEQSGSRDGEKTRDPTRPFRWPLLALVSSRRVRHLLGAALFYAGEYTRAAAVLDAAGHDYRRYFPPDDPAVLDCAYRAGHAYAETGKPGRALPQLRFYVQNADTSAGGEEAHKVFETALSSRSYWRQTATRTRRSPNSRPSDRSWPKPSARTLRRSATSTSRPHA